MPKEPEPNFERILGGGSKRVVTGQYLHVGFTLNGTAAQEMRQILAQAGVENISAYVKGLVLEDLRNRLKKTE